MRAAQPNKALSVQLSSLLSKLQRFHHLTYEITTYQKHGLCSGPVFSLKSIIFTRSLGALRALTFSYKNHDIYKIQMKNTNTKYKHKRLMRGLTAVGAR